MKKLEIVLGCIAVIGVHHVSTLKCYDCPDQKCTKNPESCEAHIIEATKVWAAKGEGYDPDHVYSKEAIPSCFSFTKDEHRFGGCVLDEFKICEAKITLEGKGFDCGGQNAIDCGFECIQCREQGCNAAESTLFIGGYMCLVSLVAFLPIVILFI